MRMSNDPRVLEAGDLIFHPLESDEDRADAFLETLRLPRDGGTFVDRTGHPLTFARSSTAELDHFTCDELSRIAETIRRPDEIRELWKRDAKGSSRLTRRYIANIKGVDVAVDINKAGWCFATSEDGGFDLARVRHGTIVWPWA